MLAPKTMLLSVSHSASTSFWRWLTPRNVFEKLLVHWSFGRVDEIFSIFTYKFERVFSRTRATRNASS
jgi:hypothetical protein